ncbi:MAG: tRNA uridine-5-carboxymethylaminomethyl(34) synthesis GTPase MnmE [Deltaproteobacteria bacterium RIFCSPLOWO2_12_FULL_43_16]|nr:MAG: tRNA uridine-5-carboxymethylaminomethyl(34) synthesis GTPase MnmE [Deltaproteobacteria bacterium GWA2_43_19]OGQ10556.1 MAG: tRNA uridine-5-carboxymethylaminomethyl(34) synthesis GTPase MnmE [Deltaproteobacteria bacterium RIFCSPHIGHO2_02_FULL_43_33]OGQ59577.1 MAG: tRNA uridine-5-carboxymethylaminomethyl(34) synthesis GTPase MnmE [Deltaproteobacteria bacterium RIFCSPLOWO2_12_FULL_43_16]HBR18542.1 tRNA uridine-5-carboxymethylaminomethyl(34) synthesis GTPase MnmE [Deltaproteobacteria bacteri
MILSDTICAIATPFGEGGIGIIRISGSDAKKIAYAVFRPKRQYKRFESRRLYYGTILNPAYNTSLDDVLMAVMERPKSFTGEDVVEFQCHGGQLVLQRVIELILRHGARLAEPGEFTKRAFLNSKIDLAQAESVIDLIRAKTDLSLRAARIQMEGQLSQKINLIKEDIVDLLVHIEAELDFSDEEDVTGISDLEIEKRLNGIKNETQKLLSTYEEGRILKEGISCVILGRPNVGKSSLLNLLLKEERAIVTPIPGTTRDIIEEIVNIKGIPLRLMDTAGLRETQDEVESIGIRFTMKRLEASQMVLFVVDISSNNFEEDIKILEKIFNKKIIVIGNKIDIADKKAQDSFRKIFKRMTKVEISALLDRGAEELRQTIYTEAMGQKVYELPDIIISNVRHKNILEQADKAVAKAEEALKDRLSGEFIAVELKEAIERLGEITGAITTEDVLDRIFSQFCIGK